MSSGFSLVMGDGGWSAPTSWKVAHYPPVDSSPPSTKGSFSHLITIFMLKFFLVVFIAYIVPFFYLNFILSVHTGHPDFDFNWCSIFTKYFFSFEKVWMVKTTPHQIPTHPIKKSPRTIISHSSLYIHLANTTWKTLIPCFLPVIWVASSKFWPY